MREDVSWDRVDDIVDAYANVYVYGGRQLDLEREIGKACGLLAEARPTINDFTYVLDTGFHSQSINQRRIAWASQHILNMRAWMVGPKLFEKEGRKYFSPLIEQVRVLGLPVVGDFDVQKFRRRARGRARYWAQSALDVILVDRVSGRIGLIKGFTWSQAKSINREVRPARAGLELFDVQDRPIVQVIAKSEALRPLLIARELLRTACPRATVECYYMLIDDSECGWNFQLHDVSGVGLARLQQSPFYRLDDVPCKKSSRDFQEVLRADSDAFAKIPNWTAKDYLALVPVDRPARALMQLREIFEYQMLAPGTLAPMPAAELAKAVESRYSLFYPVNRQRHDLDAVLRGGGFVRRPRQQNNDYAITPKGIMRMMMLNQMYSPRKDFSVGDVLEAIQVQAQNWVRVRGGASL
jgi:hypothetical protein